MPATRSAVVSLAQPFKAGIKWIYLRRRVSDAMKNKAHVSGRRYATETYNCWLANPALKGRAKLTSTLRVVATFDARTPSTIQFAAPGSLSLRTRSIAATTRATGTRRMHSGFSNSAQK